MCNEGRDNGKVHALPGLIPSFVDPALKTSTVLLTMLSPL